MHRLLHVLLMVVLALLGLWFLFLAIADSPLGPLERALIVLIAALIFLGAVRLHRRSV